MINNKIGLTYTQICNWFANWRRKLKNTSGQKKSWGNLIKNYNCNAKGNVEQFSIDSSDSIWGQNQNLDEFSLDSMSYNQNSDTEVQDLSSKANVAMHFDDQNFQSMAHGQNFNAASFFHPQNSQLTMNFLAQQAQCLHQLQSQSNESQKQYFTTHSNKFKNHIMEKYLRGLDDESTGNDLNEKQQDNSKKPELSKWLESTANFQPSKNNYNIDFAKTERSKKLSKSSSNGSGLCEKELIAAETLVLLKNLRTTKFYNS